MDTKWEHPATIDYITHYLPQHIGPINKIGDPIGLPGLIKKQLFPLMNARFCTGVLKLEPMRKHLNKKDADIVNAVGIRAEESADRSRQPMWEYSKELDAEVWRPLLNWTEQDVIDIHTAYNLLPNPLLDGIRTGWMLTVYLFNQTSNCIMARDTPKELTKSDGLNEKSTSNDDATIPKPNEYLGFTEMDAIPHR